MPDVVELGLRKPSASAEPSSLLKDRPTAAEGDSLKALAEAFLRLMADFPPDAADEDTREFAAEIKDFREQIARSSHDQETRRLTGAAVRACEQFLRKSRQFYTTREQELRELVGILRDTARHVAGDNSEFHAAMNAITERFYGMSQINDIRELKKQVADEASTLQNTLESKQKRDAETMSALAERVDTLQKNLIQANELLSQDPLTKIANRGAFDRAIAKAVQHPSRSNVPLSLAMLDIDHFKRINDTCGHPIGDRVILCVAQWITAAVRHTDFVARYGGEEFIVILEDADLSAAEKRFQSVLQRIAERSFEYQAEGETRTVRFTMSCGVAQFAAGESAQQLVQRADQALYDAKKSGRNRVVARRRSMLSGIFG
jgi:diguanylate cyclase